MNLMFDTNILLDVFQGRGEFAYDSGVALRLAIDGSHHGYVPAHGVTTAYYILRKECGPVKAIETIDWVLERFEVAPATAETFSRARKLPIKDFEDAIVAAMAEAANCELIVTRNTADFGASPIAPITPEDLLQQLGLI
ncbi:MAG: PIN domain-containing protein [Candidatus Hydrogenedentes bacterium]|nr:PIN domain-containing protein [Candidatus Hydrogenedentota bacterium]